MNTRLSRKLPVFDGLVAVKDLAESLEVDRSNLLKDLRRRGFAIEKRRCPAARGQMVAVLTRADAERFIDRLRAESLGAGGEVAYIAAE